MKLDIYKSGKYWETGKPNLYYAASQRGRRVHLVFLKTERLAIPMCASGRDFDWDELFSAGESQPGSLVSPELAIMSPWGCKQCQRVLTRWRSIISFCEGDDAWMNWTTK